MIDLHLHSTCSDGSESPTEVVNLAATAGCSALALTDHDGLAGVGEARERAEQLGIGFVAGCEVSCAFSPGAMHILSYFVEPDEGPLQSELDALRRDRELRNERLVARLGELGFPISFEELRAVSGSSVLGRPHFAAVLVAKGAASSIQDAFDRWLGKGAPGYVPKARIDPAAFLALARRSGAVTSLAHPHTLGLEPPELDGVLRELSEAGLSAMECHYGRYSTEERSALLATAARHDLVPTGGSDFHGSFKPDLLVGTGTGDLCVPDAALAELEARRPDVNA